MNLGWAVTVLALLTGVTTMAGFVALGWQRGRLQRLEVANQDLRLEIADKDRRLTDTSRKLVEMENKANTQHDELAELRAKVATQTEVIHGVTGPIAHLVQVVERTNELLSGHHREAMSGLDFMYALQVDALRLLGDKRSPARIRAELRAQEGADRAAQQ